jgi:hypothetical protein
MLVGKVLRGEDGWVYLWTKSPREGIGFYRRKENGPLCPVYDFSGLYEEV